MSRKQGLRTKERRNVPKISMLQLLSLDLRKESLGMAFKTSAKANLGNVHPFLLLE